ncbi:hypothetical protein IW261DRAFT_1415578 [Armillaria novae-zelandiae]|uniref:Uncharacterized protein n=1 Tax=Armillaria novae-zelandiae TaxID=153914 RepID=A0AA39PQS9_9AGAR|nr:hypothetical protein IW261DRAFT_1415578 [Armillaria novae-zelandiae]
MAAPCAVAAKAHAIVITLLSVSHGLEHLCGVLRIFVGFEVHSKGINVRFEAQGADGARTNEEPQWARVVWEEDSSRTMASLYAGMGASMHRNIGIPPPKCNTVVGAVVVSTQTEENGSDAVLVVHLGAEYEALRPKEVVTTGIFERGRWSWFQILEGKNKHRRWSWTLMKKPVTVKRRGDQRWDRHRWWWWWWWVDGGEEQNATSETVMMVHATWPLCHSQETLSLFVTSPYSLILSRNLWNKYLQVFTLPQPHLHHDIQAKIQKRRDLNIKNCNVVPSNVKAIMYATYKLFPTVTIDIPSEIFSFSSGE